jgi:hypothetical protein
MTLQEYLGAEMTEKERQLDIMGNPNICNYHSFTFDYVYGPESTQNFIYDNTAKTAVLSVLKVISCYVRDITRQYLPMDRQGQGKHTQWKVFLTVSMTPTKE